MSNIALEEVALAAIRAEVHALDALADRIGSLAIGDASDLIWNADGKAIVTGMGKAGLIGRKIAATLQSTGTPAAFLDPAQALHGDMGMIGRHDVVLALSNSGETDEVLAVAEFAEHNRNAMIAITSRAESPLAQRARVSLVMPGVPEGCPIGRAPMASTIMMLALGDALAAVLMARRGFTEADFLRFHHGGYLGRTIRAVA